MFGSWRDGIVLVIEQDPHCRSVGIVELAVAQCPLEGDKPEQAHAERYGYEHGETGHFADPTSRSELTTTISDDSDMATAAISGVTSPAIASGTASTL